MAKYNRANHPEVIQTEYKGRPIRFRLIDGTVYICVYDLKCLFQCCYIPYEDLHIRCNTYVRIVFYKNGDAIYAIESSDLPALCRLGNHDIISTKNQQAIDWIVDTCKKIQTNNMNNQSVTPVATTGTSELIHISDNNGQRAVNARELHAFLGSKQEFAHWIKNRIEKYGFIENQDFTSFDNFIKREKGSSVRKEYALSIDMAKELSMVENNERGKQARRYFIECERRLREGNIPSYQIEDPVKRAEKWIEERKQLQLAQQENTALQQDNTHKTKVIESLVKDVSLADMRQRINEIVRKNGVAGIKDSFHRLYTEFNAKYHINVFTRMNNAVYKGNAMDYIEKELDMMPQLYDLACKLFENSYKDIMDSWGKSAKRADRSRNISSRQQLLN